MTAEKLKTVGDVVTFVEREFEKQRNPEYALKMAAYMKTEMPFFGVRSPQQKEIYRDAKNRFTIDDNETYRELVTSLWACDQREQKYVALLFATKTTKFVTYENLDLYESLIRTGAWWDFVDSVAPKCIGRLHRTDPDQMTPILRSWNEDDDMWIRRSSIIAQLGHKQETDEELLFELCRARMHETEFFIRKAIGWSLREHAKRQPDSVVDFLETHRDELSGLSFREGAKHLLKQGKIEK